MGNDDRLRVGSAFSGIGGIDLGLQWAGMEIAWQIENDDYCTKVLQKHWPNVPRWSDIQRVGIGELPEVDLIAAGFPCQDISCAGSREGIDGTQSRVFWDLVGIIRALGPRYVLLENVAALLIRGADDVFGALASSGYDCQWDCIPAAAVGAPHFRDRVFIVAYSQSARRQSRIGNERDKTGAWVRGTQFVVGGQTASDTNGRGCQGIRQPQHGFELLESGTEPDRRGPRRSGTRSIMADADHERLQRRGIPRPLESAGKLFAGQNDSLSGYRQFIGSMCWFAQCRLGRDPDGIPAGLDANINGRQTWEEGVPRLVRKQKNRAARLRGLGNAVVPQVAHWIGMQIIRFDGERR